MAIKARCGGCGASFQAKDSLAGRKVKCPKCAQPMQIPSKQPAANKPKPVHNPLLDLLDEADVKSAALGPTCPSCSAEMAGMAVICVQCGYNVETGEQLKTVAHDDDAGITDVGVTDADRLMAQAERDIEDMPVTAVGQDFGDGADSFVLAGVAGLVMLVLVGIGVGVILTMDVISKTVAPSYISYLASLAMSAAMAIWITIIAFRQKPVHGIACILSGGLWCVIYGFMQGKQLIVPTVILLASILIGIASGLYYFLAESKNTQLISEFSNLIA